MKTVSASALERAAFEKNMALRLQKELKREGKNLTLFECLCVVKTQVNEGKKYLELVRQ
jgi:hypothetical protein